MLYLYLLEKKFFDDLHQFSKRFSNNFLIASNRYSVYSKHNQWQSMHFHTQFGANYIELICTQNRLSNWHTQTNLFPNQNLAFTPSDSFTYSNHHWHIESVYTTIYLPKLYVGWSVIDANYAVQIEHSFKPHLTNIIWIL